MQSQTEACETFGFPASVFYCMPCSPPDSPEAERQGAGMTLLHTAASTKLHHRNTAATHPRHKPKRSTIGQPSPQHGSASVPLKENRPTARPPHRCHHQHRYPAARQPVLQRGRRTVAATSTGPPQPDSPSYSAAATSGSLK